MTDLEKEELIVYFMGYIHKTEAIIEIEHGNFYNCTYEKSILYTKLPPKLIEYKETFLDTLVDTHLNYFDSDTQDDSFEYKTYLWYKDNWNELMLVIDKIESIVNNKNISLYNFKIEQSFVEIIDNITSDTIVEIDKNSKVETVFEAIVEFIIWFNLNKSLIK